MKNFGKVLILILLFVCATKYGEATSEWTRMHPRVQKEDRYWVQQEINAREVKTEYEQVNRFYQKRLNKKERKFLNNLCWEQYAFSYYSTLSGFTGAAEEVIHLQKETERRLKKMKRDRIYTRILRKTRGDEKHHLIKYIVRRLEAGEYDAYVKNTQNARDGGGMIKAKDVLFYSESREISLIPSGETAKMLLVILLALAAVAAIAGLAGALCCPHLPVFRGVRTLLEY